MQLIVRSISHQGKTTVAYDLFVLNISN